MPPTTRARNRRLHTTHDTTPTVAIDAPLAVLGTTELISLIFHFLPSCPTPVDNPQNNTDDACLTGAEPLPLLRCVAGVCRAWRDAVPSLIRSRQWRKIHCRKLMNMLRGSVCDEQLLQRLAIYPEEAVEVTWARADGPNDPNEVLLKRIDGTTERVGLSTFFHEPVGNMTASHQLMTLDMRVRFDGRFDYPQVGRIVSNHMPSTPQAILGGGYALNPMMESGVYFDEDGHFKRICLEMPGQSLVEFGVLPAHAALWARRSAAVVGTLCSTTPGRRLTPTSPTGLTQYSSSQYYRSWWTAGEPADTADPAVLASQLPCEGDTVLVLVRIDEEGNEFEDYGDHDDQFDEYYRVGIVRSLAYDNTQPDPELYSVDFVSVTAYPLLNMTNLKASEVRLLKRGSAFVGGGNPCCTCRGCITYDGHPQFWSSNCTVRGSRALLRMAEALEVPGDVLAAIARALGPLNDSKAATLRRAMRGGSGISSGRHARLRENARG